MKPNIAWKTEGLFFQFYKGASACCNVFKQNITTLCISVISIISIHLSSSPFIAKASALNGWVSLANRSPSSQ